MTTIELSTTIPSTTIRAASVTVLSSMPAAYITATEINVLSGTVMAATMALLMGNSTIITRMIINIEMSRSRRKSLTLSPTTFGWSAMRVSVTSSGSSVALYSFSTLSTSLPYCTILLPGFISSESRMQRCPSCSI